jgi:hypothetical protein
MRDDTRARKERDGGIVNIRKICAEGKCVTSSCRGIHDSGVKTAGYPGVHGLSSDMRVHRSLRGHAVRLVVLLSLLLPALRPVFAKEDGVDSDRLQVRALWWFSLPSGYFKSSTDEGGGLIDLHRDFGFGSYSTFSGNLDWRFARKHHLLIGVSPVNSERTTTLGRTIEFQGVTYDIGTKVVTDFSSSIYSPGYQWDFMRRKQWYLALAAHLNVLDSSAHVTGTVTVNDHSATVKSSGARIAPIPAVGPRFRWFPIHDSRRLDLDTSVEGMYLFGYGDFWSGRAVADIAVARHCSITAGYQLGTRLSIHGSSDQVGLRLTQKGPVAGIQTTW